jgi:hypothetical protein
MRVTDRYFHAASSYKPRTALLMTKMDTQTNLLAQLATRLLRLLLESQRRCGRSWMTLWAAFFSVTPYRLLKTKSGIINQLGNDLVLPNSFQFITHYWSYNQRYMVAIADCLQLRTINHKDILSCSGNPFLSDLPLWICVTNKNGKIWRGTLK